MSLCFVQEWLSRFIIREMAVWLLQYIMVGSFWVILSICKSEYNYVVFLVDLISFISLVMVVDVIR